MIPRTAKAAVGRRILDAFVVAGAVEVAPDVLLPSATLLDLYGEDIRARAYLTTDPVRGEVVLRPDFTVPVVQMHMAGGADPAPLPPSCAASCRPRCRPAWRPPSAWWRPTRC